MDNEVINAFYREFHAARDESEQRQAIVKSCQRLKTKEQARVADLAADAAAIIWLVRQRWGATGDVPRCVPEGEILIQLSKGVPPKKSYSVKHLIVKWGPARVQHYRFDLLGEKSLRQLVRAAGKHREWDDFVSVANSVMLWRHEQCATSASSQKNKAEFLIGQYPVACKASAQNRPLLPVDIENIKKAMHTNFATPERLRLWTSSCVTCFEKNAQHKLPGGNGKPGTTAFLLLRKDRYDMLVPLSRANRACTDCCLPAKTIPNKKRKRPDEPSADRRIADSDPQALLSSIGSLSPTPPEPDNQFRLEDAARVLQEKEKAAADTAEPVIGAIDICGRDSCGVQLKDQSSHSRPPLGAESGPSPSREELQGYRSSNHICPYCPGQCTRCEVPGGYSSLDAVQLYRIAHEAPNGNSKGDTSYDTLLSYIHFADPLYDLGAGNSSKSKAWILPWDDTLKDYLEDPTSPLPELLVIRSENFSDAPRYSPQQYAEMLRLYCGGKHIPARVDGDSQLEFCDGNEIADHLLGKCAKLQNKVVNVLSLKGITNAVKPSFTRILRFCFLQALIHRLKAEEADGNAGKQTYRSPFDVSSCTDFNILGFEGAYSGAHVDLLGATWLRNLFGTKLWWYIPRASMTPEDRGDFETNGSQWNPGDKAKAVLLSPGDVLVMFEPVVHLVYTVDTCLMEGGMFCDSHRRMAFIKHVAHVASMPDISNEPLAYQLPLVIEELKQIEQRETKSPELNDVMKAIDNLAGCKCRSCVVECGCRKRRARCTHWCEGHPVVPFKGNPRSCMVRN